MRCKYCSAVLEHKKVNATKLLTHLIKACNKIPAEVKELLSNSSNSEVAKQNTRQVTFNVLASTLASVPVKTELAVVGEKRTSEDQAPSKKRIVQFVDRVSPMEIDKANMLLTRFFVGCGISFNTIQSGIHM